MNLEESENPPATELTLQPGEQKRRGRPKGSIGARAKMARAIVDELDFDPLRFLLRVAKNKRYDINLRVKAASDCLSFVHAKLSTTFVTAKVDSTVDVNHRMFHAIQSDPVAALKAQELFLMLNGFDENGLPVHQLPPVDPERL